MPLYAPASTLPANAIDNAELVDMAQATVKGRAAGAGTGDPTDLTQAQLVGVLDTASVSLTKVLTVSISGPGDALRMYATDSDAAEGPSVLIARDSASPAVNDTLGVVRFQGKNSINTWSEYGGQYVRIENPASGAETGTTIFYSRQAGGYTDIAVGSGLRVGGPTGGFKGIGTVNAGAYYVNGTLLADSGGINVGMIPVNSVGMDRLPDMAAGHVMARQWAVGTGDPQHVHYDTLLKEMATNVGGDVQWYSRGIWHQPDGADVNNPTGDYGAIQIQGIAGYGAIMAFHRPGAFACYFGLGTDNQLRIGGWSYGAVSHAIFHAGRVAWAALMAAGSDNTYAVTPGSVYYHKGVSKGWALVNTGGGYGQNWGMAYMSDLDVGRMRFLYANSTESVYPIYLPSIETMDVLAVRVEEWSSWWCTVGVYGVNSAAYQDPNHYLCAMWGTLP